MNWNKMKSDYKGLVWRFRLLCVLWSLTFLSLGIGFVYAALYECIITEFDLALKTYSLGFATIGLFFSVGLSINFYLYRTKYERSIF
jgi:hypothetical protein